MRLRLINTLLYAGLAIFAASIIGHPLRLAWQAVVRRFSYVPDLNTPWAWLAIGAALALVVMSTARQLAQGKRAGLVRYALLLAVTIAAFSTRKLLTTPARPTITDALAHLVARVELAADAVYSKQKAYPHDASVLTQQWPDELRDLGYFKRGGVLLRSQLYVQPDTFGPVLVAPSQVQPGDVVVSVSNDRRRFWVTAFVLDRAGRIVPHADSAGRVIVASAIEGRPASRLDPLFPEYPNKNPHPSSMGPSR